MSTKKHPNPLTWRPKPETRLALNLVAQQLGVSRSRVLQLAVEQYLAQQRKTPAA